MDRSDAFRPCGLVASSWGACLRWATGTLPVFDEWHADRGVAGGTETAVDAALRQHVMQACPACPCGMHAMRTCKAMWSTLAPCTVSRLSAAVIKHGIRDPCGYWQWCAEGGGMHCIMVSCTLLQRSSRASRPLARCTPQLQLHAVHTRLAPLHAPASKLHRVTRAHPLHT